jgi:predicted nucleic acid-binding protein
LLEILTFDTEPLVGFFFGEARAKPVIELLEKIQQGDVEGYISIVNLTEVYYAIARKDRKSADEKIRLLCVFGLKVVSAEENEVWREAALIKNKYALSLGDSFAVATAQALKAKLVVGSDKALNELPVELLKIK